MKHFGITFILALTEIRRHLMRSFLTTLGIMIGVSSLVTMVSLGRGTTLALQAQISTLGSNMVTIRPGQGFGRGGGGPLPPNFRERDVVAIRDQIAGVDWVVPVVQASATAVHNSANWSTTISGSTRDYFTAQQWGLQHGRVFSEAEQQSGKSVCVIGDKVRQKLFRDENPVGQLLRVRDLSCQVIGLLDARGQGGMGADQDDVVVLPIKTVQRRITGTRDVGSIMMIVNSDFDATTIQKLTTDLLRERRNISPGEDDDFNLFDTKQIADTMNTVTRTMTALLAAVAAVSLLVGGIGIMNIMLVSVTERTREIGIRLAIGAVADEVLMQFLVEAVVLSSLGGLVGLLLAAIAIWGIGTGVGIPVLFLPGINLLAFFSAAAIGVAFGYFPAKRAANLNPIDALRHE